MEKWGAAIEIITEYEKKIQELKREVTETKKEIDTKIKQNKSLNWQKKFDEFCKQNKIKKNFFGGFSM